jgi:hypothetical protein
MATFHLTANSFQEPGGSALLTDLRIAFASVACGCSKLEGLHPHAPSTRKSFASSPNNT